MASQSAPLLAYYGDDFTGSTDALEFLTRAGAATALFMTPPTPEQLAAAGPLQAVGVAGITRAMPPAAMEAALRPAFAALKALGPAHVHYKVCSTFDSSPAIGSIGRAIEIGAEIFAARFVPLLVAAPALGRHCVFGNLFARMGIGSAGKVYRLDRHPSMSKHPVTPMHESDLRAHVAKQTELSIGLFDILMGAGSQDDARNALERLVEEEPAIILFDALRADEMPRLGALIDAYAQDGPLFSVGSSGIEMALGAHWAAQGKLTPKTDWPDPGAASPLLVVSGSCSPVTAGQIAWAKQNGFADVALDTTALATDDSKTAVEVAMSETVLHLKAGRSVVVHTHCGEGDIRSTPTTAALVAREADPIRRILLAAEVFGTALGRIARSAIEQAGIKRLVIAGGDTSGFAARALGIASLTMIAPLAPGAPLCKAIAPGSPADGLEVNFKGGQVGAEDYFGRVMKGRMK